jgi:putative transposase
MRGPKPPAVTLGEEERAALERLARGHTTGQQVALRARIILLAGEGRSNCEIARRLGLKADTVRLWRQRWLGFRGLPLRDLSVAARLADAPRPGVPARITPEQVCRIVELGCEPPADSERPISQWTSREIADEVVKRGIVDRISPRHAARLLKIWGPQAAPGALLADAGPR